MIGLIEIGEYDEARSEMFKLLYFIIVSKPELSGLDLDVVTADQVEIIDALVNVVYLSIEYSICKLIKLKSDLPV